MKWNWILIIILFPMGLKSQDLAIYKNKLPEHLEKHPKNGSLRLSKDSIVLLNDLRVATYRRIEMEKKGRIHKYYVFYQNNGKPIGHAMIKDSVKCKVLFYEDRVGSQEEQKYSPEMDEYERIILFARYFLGNGLL